MFSNNFINQSGTSPLLYLPHPEEPMNPAATISNSDSASVINKWLLNWEVPKQHWDSWKKAIDIQVYDIYPASIIAMGMSQDTPAATWDADGRRHLAIKPKWLNPGVIAHEQAHNSYSFLNSEMKANFAALYTALKDRDQVLKLLFTMNSYGLTNDVEGHAEIYRYMGQQMPIQLKQYYPLLF